MRFGAVLFTAEEPLSLNTVLRPHFPALIQYVLKATGLSLTSQCRRELAALANVSDRELRIEAAAQAYRRTTHAMAVLPTPAPGSTAANIGLIVSRPGDAFEFGLADLKATDVRTKQISAINFYAGKNLMIQAFNRYARDLAAHDNAAAVAAGSGAGLTDAKAPSPTTSIVTATSKANGVGLRTLSLAVAAFDAALASDSLNAAALRVGLLCRIAIEELNARYAKSDELVLATVQTNPLLTDALRIDLLRGQLVHWEDRLRASHGEFAPYQGASSNAVYHRLLRTALPLIDAATKPAPASADAKGQAVAAATAASATQLAHALARVQAKRRDVLIKALLHMFGWANGDSKDTEWRTAQATAKPTNAGAADGGVDFVGTVSADDRERFTLALSLVQLHPIPTLRFFNAVFPAAADADSEQQSKPTEYAPLSAAEPALTTRERQTLSRRNVNFMLQVQTIELNPCRAAVGRVRVHGTGDARVARLGR